MKTTAPVRAPRSFQQILADKNLRLDRVALKTLQINVGKLCNQACRHCHVEAGPSRTEIMPAKVVDQVLKLLSAPHSVTTVDITGGAPELCPDFRRLVEGMDGMGIQIIDRCNLTVFEEKGQKDLPEFLARHRIRVIASLPCYTADNVDKQRGKGVFAKSIRALQKLNSLGYAKEGTGLGLDLVYNPLGPYLPPAQEKLEAEYKDRLRKDFGIEFSHLFCITNMPVKRFHQDLDRSGKLAEYMDLLLQNFNPHAAEGVMCRDLLSVGWDGKIYDCDFNQMLEIPLPRPTRTIFDVKSLNEFNEGKIAFADHCFGCTAGTGSSCTGTLEAEKAN
jgi:radical SAM/Cys-rich protein